MLWLQSHCAPQAGMWGDRLQFGQLRPSRGDLCHSKTPWVLSLNKYCSQLGLILTILSYPSLQDGHGNTLRPLGSPIPRLPHSQTLPRNPHQGRSLHFFTSLGIPKQTDYTPSSVPPLTPSCLLPMVGSQVLSIFGQMRKQRETQLWF